MEWRHSSNILILIFCKMLLVSGNCLKCPPGGCRKDQYLLRKPTGRYMCEVCTEPCSAAKRLVEVQACGNSTNRVCHCAKGHYCSEPQNFSCLFSCTPCQPGTYSSQPNLWKRCKRYTDCEGRGVITEGTATQDRVCATTTTPTLTPTTTTTVPTTTTTTTTTSNAPIITSGVFSSHNTSHTAELTDSASTAMEDMNKGEPSQITGSVPNAMPFKSNGNTVTTDHTSRVKSNLSSLPPASPTSRQSSLNSSTIFTTLAKPGKVTPRTDDGGKTGGLFGSSSHPWLTLLLLLLVVSVLVGCFLWLKGKALKKQLNWTRGLPFGKYQVTKKEAGGYNIYAPPMQQQHEQPHEANPCVERLLPLNTENGAQMREGGTATQPHPGQGSTQHITMDNSGRGESISNTVGSIFIYSPGMVVLGTNASERREEMRPEGTEQHLSSIPTQESRSTSTSSNPDSVGLSTQEEDEDKELSYPIPASGK